MPITSESRLLLILPLAVMILSLTVLILTLVVLFASGIGRTAHDKHRCGEDDG